MSIPIGAIDINGISTVHVVTGDGTPVLMLHGWGANIELVWPLAQQLAPKGYRLYIADLPGFGRTAPPPTAWTVHDYVDFVLAYAQYHSLDQFYLFGHSFGGRLGLVLGAEHGQRIPKMVLADAAGIRAKTPFIKQARLSAYKAVRDGLKTIGMGGLSDNLREWYNRRYASSDFQSVTGVMRETFIKVINEDLRPFAARVQPSTLLLWGDQDEDTPLWQAKILESTIPDAGLVVYEGAGHYSYLDRLYDAAQVIDFFFRQD